MKYANKLMSDLSGLIVNKTVGDIIDYETDNIYSKSAASSIIKNYISKKYTFGLEVFKQYDIILKFIPVNEHYKCHEAMPISRCSLYDIIFEKWNTDDEYEVSELKHKLKYNYLFIPIIKIKNKGVYNHYQNWTVGQLSYWKPNNEEILKIGLEWLEVQTTLKKGIKTRTVRHGKTFRNQNNLPKESKTKYIHLRSHARDSQDYDKKYHEYTKGEVKITKQSFWLNKNFLNSLILENKWMPNSREE